ncbi:MAG TPA: OsmC family peroxiredoxin, partial [Ktedonobacteraceae bacterium]
MALKAERRAEVEWQGSLIQGSGTIVSVGSGAIGNLPVTWASRTERSDGKTSPEELLAAAHAACFAMAFSHGLAQAGTTAE